MAFRAAAFIISAESGLRSCVSFLFQRRLRGQYAYNNSNLR
jgi:hypothetical protein